MENFDGELHQTVWVLKIKTLLLALAKCEAFSKSILILSIRIERSFSH